MTKMRKNLWIFSPLTLDKTGTICKLLPTIPNFRNAYSMIHQAFDECKLSSATQEIVVVNLVAMVVMMMMEGAYNSTANKAFKYL